MIPLHLLASSASLPASSQVLQSSVAKQILSYLKTTSQTGGTATRAKVQHIAVAGKTGTVRKVSPEGGYTLNNYLALYAGIIPADAPRYVMVNMMDNPKDKGYYGGVVAAPVFAKVMEQLKMLQYFS